MAVCSNFNAAIGAAKTNPGTIAGWF